MPRTLSAALIASKNELASVKPWAFLFQLDITGAPTPIRFTNANQTVTYQGNAFLPFPVQLDLPENTSGEFQRVRARVGNIDQQVSSLLENYWIGVVDPVWTVTVWRVDLTQPDETPATQGETFSVLGATTDLVLAQFELQAGGITVSETVPRRRYTTSGGFPFLPRVPRR